MKDAYFDNVHRHEETENFVLVENPVDDSDGSEYCPVEYFNSEEDEPEASPVRKKGRLAPIKQTNFAQESPEFFSSYISESREPDDKSASVRKLAAEL